MQSLNELFIDQLRDVHNAEKQLTKALPKMAKAASSPNLRAAFQEHLEQTKEHISRLEKVFEELGIKVGRKTCAAMEGLVAEGKEIIEEEPAPEVLDAGLIAAAQRVEHYEIAAYGTLRSFAQTLGHAGAARVFEQTLKEERDTDEKLTSLAESEINPRAVQNDETDEE
ncbi:MAG: ferritin-like domain-containing protein [Isosphaeraceae bacterium]